MGIEFSDVTAQKLAFITNRRELYFQVKWYSRESSFRYGVRGNNLKVKWVFDIKSNMPIQHRSLELFLYPLYFQSNANYIYSFELWKEVGQHPGFWRQDCSGKPAIIAFKTPISGCLNRDSKCVELSMSVEKNLKGWMRSRCVGLLHDH